MGIINATDQVELSFIEPSKKEITAPPTMEVDKRPEARGVYFPNPLTDSEKMVANIMELHSPTAIMLQTAIYPGVLTEIPISRMDKVAQALKTTGGLTDCSTAEPTNRPINMPPQ